MNQCFLDKENGLEGMRMDQVNKGEFPENVEDLYRRTYLEALDLIVCSVKERFDQLGYKVYSNLECVLVKAVKKDNYDEELKTWLTFTRVA